MQMKKQIKMQNLNFQLRLRLVRCASIYKIIIKLFFSLGWNARQQPAGSTATIRIKCMSVVHE